MLPVSGIILILIVKANLLFASHAEENTSYNNGWRPISNEKVLGDLRRNFIKRPEIEHFSASWNPVVHSTENVGYIEQITNVKPQDINVELMNEGNYYGGLEMDANENIRDITVTDSWSDLNDHEYLSSSEANKKDKPTRSRKAKEIEDAINNNNIPHDNKNIIQAVNKTLEVKMKENNTTNDELNKYEVTEASEVISLLENNHNKDKRKYFVPTLKRINEENLTTKLFNILGNYNIRTNDDLTNYGASRNNYNSIYRKQSYVYPASSYNSHNHYPVDPLFAVFLSNYGYYLPGFYGFPGNYYNIYGYLASNNIHNNKPFGAYKIYSDTDSSH